MEGGAIRTKRLTLRPHRPEDAGALCAGIGDWEVIRWLTSPPWPYTLADAVRFLASPAGAEATAIEVDGLLAGNIGIHHQPGAPEFGYWLARPFWGRGFMTEATTVLLARHFATGGSDLVSGYLVGNDRSARVLGKLGFRDTERIQRLARPLGREVPLQRMELTRAAWQAAHG